MKLQSKLLAFGLFNTCVLGTTAFAPIQSASQVRPSMALGSLAQDIPAELGMFPSNLKLERYEGGDSLRTFQMPMDGDRCHYYLRTNGRPMNARIEMWQGPNRVTHTMDIYMQDGSQTPLRALLKWKKGPQVLRILNTGESEMPFDAGVEAVSPERSQRLEAVTLKTWEANSDKKTILQGGYSHATGGGGGAVRSFPIDNDAKSVQLLFWSGALGKKSCKAIIEVLQGPNNVKQKYDLSLSGSSQPYHLILTTPGSGVTVRIQNKNFVEFPYEVMVLPFEKDAPSSGEWGGAAPEWR
mmetsp:Transcript_15727/g.19173  ORF Transcript_15727/g.19173 Transcript_15727/m.19173 type:complete len:297 (+) Transcript_15727:101-991(+)